MFLIGFLAAFNTRFWESLQRLRWVSLAVTALCYGALVHSWYLAGYDDAHPLPDALRIALRVAWAADQWCAMAALLGFAYRWRGADRPVLRYLTIAVFPVYILHQTVIVVLAHAWKPLLMPPGIESVMLICATFVLCFAGYELIRRSRILRPLFGLRTETSAATSVKLASDY